MLWLLCCKWLNPGPGSSYSLGPWCQGFCWGGWRLVARTHTRGAVLRFAQQAFPLLGFVSSGDTASRWDGWNPGEPRARQPGGTRQKGPWEAQVRAALAHVLCEHDSLFFPSLREKIHFINQSHPVPSAVLNDMITWIVFSTVSCL